MENPHLFCDVEDAAKMDYDPCMGFLCLNKIDATPHDILLADEAVNHYCSVLTKLRSANGRKEHWKERARKAEADLKEALGQLEKIDEERNEQRIRAENAEAERDSIAENLALLERHDQERIDGLEKALKTLLDTWELAEGNRGCYSCHNPHDCRCPAILHDPPGECVCYREDLEAAADRAKEVLGGGET